MDFFFFSLLFFCGLFFGAPSFLLFYLCLRVIAQTFSADGGAALSDDLELEAFHAAHVM